MALTDNLVSYWKLDESSGNASDSSGNSVTLTNNNTLTYTGGKINNGATFASATTKCLTTSAGVSLFTNAFTISMWVKPAVADFSNNELFAYAPSSGSANIVKCEGTATDEARFIIFDSAGNFRKDYRSNTNIFAQNTWTYFTATWDGTTLLLYANGSVLSPTKTIDDGATLTSTSRYFGLGIEAPSALIGNKLDAMLDEVGIWSRALSSTEVNELYNSGNGKQYPFSINFTITEVLTLSETITNIRTRLFTLAETLGLVEATSFLKGIAFNITDSLGLVEAFTATRTFLFTIAESTGLIEVLVEIKKKWNNIAKSVSSWTNENKNSSSWTNENKS